MNYSVNQIIRDVRVRMGLNAEATQALILSDEQLTIDQQITAQIAEAVAQAHADAPADWLVNAKSFAGEITRDGSHGSIALPSDWLRLVSFAMSDWQQPVLTAITCDHPAYALQRSPYPGLRGTPEKPVCAITPDRRLEFYSCCTKNAGIAHALYMPMPAIVDDAVDIAPRCYPQVIALIQKSIS